MRSKTVKSRLAAALLLTACVFNACFLSACLFEPKEKTAGVDDFPNSIYARVDGFLDENRKAEGLESAPPEGLVIRQSVSVPVAQKKIAAGSPVAFPVLGKLAAGSGPAACPLTFTFSEKKAPVGARVTVDTLIFCMDALFTDTIKGNEHIVRGKSVTRDTVSGRIEIGEFTDGDGDGLINPLPQGASRTWLKFTVIDKGITEKTSMLVGDGPDDDFNTEKDNLVYELSHVKTLGADTLAHASYADADSDGVAIDNGKPSLVDVIWYAKGPTEDDPDAVWTRIDMRIVAVYGSKKNEVRRFSVESETRDGRLNSAVILAMDGGADFEPKDTVTARFQVVGTAPADTVDTLETVLRLKLGDFDDKRDDTTYAIQALVIKKLGEERRASFSFLSDRPIPHGKEPETGTLSMAVEYTDDTSMEVEGKITAETLDVTATLRDGKRVHAVWDRSGKGISLETLD